MVDGQMSHFVSHCTTRGHVINGSLVCPVCRKRYKQIYARKERHTGRREDGCGWSEKGCGFVCKGSWISLRVVQVPASVDSHGSARRVERGMEGAGAVPVKWV